VAEHFSQRHLRVQNRLPPLGFDAVDGASFLTGYHDPGAPADDTPVPEPICDG